MEAWSKFVMAVQLCLQRKITDFDVMKIQSLLVEFFIHYEKYNYLKIILIHIYILFKLN